MNLEELKSKAAEAIELAKKATEGPWKCSMKGFTSEAKEDFLKTWEIIGSDHEFIRNARTLVPTLAEGVLELIEKLAIAEEALDRADKLYADDKGRTIVLKEALEKIRGEAT